ncbi:MAG: hypothetical protein ACR2RA_17025 [Geminicoccaceae bacterium]
MAVLLILSMLSACAGRQAPEQDPGSAGGPSDGENAPGNYADADDMDVAYLNKLREQRALAAAHRGGRHDHRRYAHHHSEPSPEAQQAAEAVLLLTASAFVCTFVVVVLDGSCSFGAHAGYYY